jgi:NHLM bacteriocin system ABC transporter ATP-binding protein
MQTDSASSAAFLIDDPEQLWTVEQGCVDLFLSSPLVESQDRREASPRRHLLRVKESGILFGISPTMARRTLIAVSSPDAELRAISRRQFPELGAEAENVRALDWWVEELTASVAGAVPPRRYEPLDPGGQTAVDSRPVSPRSGVVWAWTESGAAQFLGDSSLPPIDGDCLFPVSSRGWLEPNGAAQFQALGTVDVLRSEINRDLGWRGLGLFHEVVSALLDRGADAEEAAEREGAQRRLLADDRCLNAALRQLAAPVDPRVAETAEAATGDLWLSACRLLGKRLEIDFRAPGNSALNRAAEPLAAIAKASGVRYRSILLAEGWWKREHGPLLARLETGRTPIALLPSARGYEYCNPADSSSGRVDEEMAATLEPFGWCFYRALPARAIRVPDLLAFGLAGCRREIVSIFLAGIGAALLAMVMPFATGYVFDNLIPGAKRADLGTVGVLLLLVALCGTLFEMTRAFALLRIEGRMDAAIQAAIWNRLLALPVAFFRSFTAGDLAMRGLGIHAIREILTGSAVTSLLSGIFSLTSFALLCYYNLKLAGIAAVLTLGAFLFVAACGYAQLRQQRWMAQIQGRLAGVMLQIVNGIAKIRVSGAAPRAFAHWAREFAAQKQLSVECRRISNRVAVFTAVFPILCSMTIFYLYADGLAHPTAGQTPMSTGDFVGFTAAFAQLTQASLGLAAALISVLGIAPLYDRARPILEGIPEVDGEKSDPGELNGDIEVRHVTFRYRQDGPPILKDISLKFAPGQFVALVGASGSGKSTLCRLLLRFETPESGSIFYDQRDLANLDVQAVRQQIGVVLQNGRIRAGSIYSNLVGTSALTLDDAWEAARMAGLDADIEAMPMGMQTVLGEGGGSLSGGQRQRLLIARALVRRPRIVFLDEATSALDNETQSIVSRSLDNLRATRVVIAHRLSTIEKADWIYVLDQGELVEQGPYQELLSKDGPFAALAKRQLTGRKDTL